MTLVNEGRRDAYVVVLDLMPDGRIDMLYPGRDEMGEDNKLRRGKSFTIPKTFVVGEPLGNEMLKLIASRNADRSATDPQCQLRRRHESR